MSPRDDAGISMDVMLARRFPPDGRDGGRDAVSVAPPSPPSA